jgi:integrase
MASLWKRPNSKLWWGCFTDQHGRQVKRSTGTPNRSDALTITTAWEKAAKAARKGTLVEAQVRKVISEILEEATGQPLHFASVAEFFHEWCRGKLGESAHKTALKYRQTSENFLAAIGPKATLSIAAIGPADIRAWRDALQTGGRSPATVNGSIKVLSAGFEQARRLGYIPSNPCLALGSLRDVDKGERDVFTQAQVRSLVEAAQGSDWEGAVLTGFFTGLRLKDIANLTWDSVDLDNAFLKVRTAKTGKTVAVPLHPELADWLRSRNRGIGKAPVFPALTGKYTGGKSGLSGQFKRLMERAEIRGRILRAGSGEGRTTSALSFHSLRHSFVSALANAGVPAELRKELAGHSTDASHKVYTHHETERLRNAVSALPGVR